MSNTVPFTQDFMNVFMENFLLHRAINHFDSFHKKCEAQIINPFRPSAKN